MPTRTRIAGRPTHEPNIEDQSRNALIMALVIVLLISGMVQFVTCLANFVRVVYNSLFNFQAHLSEGAESVGGGLSWSDLILLALLGWLAFRGLVKLAHHCTMVVGNMMAIAIAERLLTLVGDILGLDIGTSRGTIPPEQTRVEDSDYEQSRETQNEEIHNEEAQYGEAHNEKAQREDVQDNKAEVEDAQVEQELVAHPRNNTSKKSMKKEKEKASKKRRRGARF